MPSEKQIYQATVDATLEEAQEFVAKVEGQFGKEDKE